MAKWWPYWESTERESGAITQEDGLKKIKDAICRMSVSWPELRPKAVAVASESKQGTEAGRVEMAIERHVLLISVRRVFRRVHIHDETLLLLSPHEQFVPSICSSS